MSKIGGGAKDEESHIANMSDESDKASADFGHNPKGWREFCIRALSRPEAKSCQRNMGFMVLGTLYAHRQMAVGGALP